MTHVAPDHRPRANGRRLTSLRAIYGLTQIDLAEHLEVTQSFLSHLERGDRPVPDALLMKASREFSLPVSFFTVDRSLAATGQATFRKNSRASARDEARVVALFDEAARLFRGVSRVRLSPS